MTELSPPAAMLRIVSGFWVSQIVYVAAVLRLADRIREKPRTVEDLAAIAGAHAPSLYRLLRALASVGIFQEDEDNLFRMTPLAETLLSDVPGSLRAFAISELGGGHYQGWGNLLYSIKTGEVAFEEVTGKNIWDYLSQHTDEARIFDASMTDISMQVVGGVLANYDFSKAQTIVDVAGGQGSLLATILQSNPNAKGILFDLPEAIAGAKEYLKETGVGDRCTTVAGNFFSSVPGNGDIYILKWIIHDWDDEDSVRLLKSCYRAMPDNAKLLIIEDVIAPGNAPSFGKLLDVNMLVMTGGRERTADEYRDLLGAAGFILAQIISASDTVSILEARKIC